MRIPSNESNKIRGRVRSKRVIQLSKQLDNDLLVFQCITNITSYYKFEEEYKVLRVGMITSKRQKCCFIIVNNFVMIKLHESILRIQQINISFSQSDIFFTQLNQVPSHLCHLFNSVRHIYNYLTTHPECMIQMTESYLKFVVEVNGSSQICCLEMKLLQLQKSSLALKKKGYEICMKTQEVKWLKQRSSSEVNSLNKKLYQNKKLSQIQRQNLNHLLSRQKLLSDQLKDKKAQCLQLQQSLHQKQEILMQIKMREGAFVALDD